MTARTHTSMTQIMLKMRLNTKKRPQKVQLKIGQNWYKIDHKLPKTDNNGPKMTKILTKIEKEFTSDKKWPNIGQNWYKIDHKLAKNHQKLNLDWHRNDQIDKNLPNIGQKQSLPQIYQNWQKMGQILPKLTKLIKFCPKLIKYWPKISQKWVKKVKKDNNFNQNWLN